MSFIERLPNWVFYLNYALAVLWFLLWEFMAVARDQKGDTFSELIYAFLRGGPARYILVGGIFVSLVGWLFIHFFWQGKHG